MTDTAYPHSTRAAYDTVAVDYERLLRDELSLDVSCPGRPPSASHASWAGPGSSRPPS
ncbi:hypothetical protein [Streptomyces sp. A0642]|uniref:hypothetical protein n=1 Tax=Streptomyces sp. A0642 TaxID=2563100 RepID=UPI0014459DC9|nr:hypothetical protein [Streptomyces sp. A0642]